MNLEIHHKADQFQEIHPSSLKELPLMETIDAEILPGYESLVIRFRTPAREPKKFNLTDKTTIGRLHKFFAQRDGLTKLIGHWKHVTGDKKVVEDPGGVKHEEVTYNADYFVFEGEGSTLALRMQRLEDLQKIVFCPPDQTREFKAHWTRVRWNGEKEEDAAGWELTINLASVRVAGLDPLDDEIQKLAALDDADLQTLAPAIGVKWDEKASRDTMVKRMAKKRLEKKQAAPAATAEKLQEVGT